MRSVTNGPNIIVYIIANITALVPAIVVVFVVPNVIVALYP